MAHIAFHARLKNIRRLTPLIRELNFSYEADAKPDFKTGQFYMLHVPTADGVVKRAYSISSSHHDHAGFSLIMKLVPDGIASRYVETLKSEQSVEFTGPFGKCVFQLPPHPRTLFLSTGAGIAQHYSMLLSELEALRTTQIHLLLGVWNPDEIFYQAELEELRRRLPRFTYEYVLDQKFEGWSGKVGYVTQFLSEFAPAAADTMIYACGNPDMIKGAKKLLVEEHGFPKDHFIAESFTHSPPVHAAPKT